jgi:cytochrome c
VLRANYKDKGNPATGTLTGSSLLTLRHPKVEAEDADYREDVSIRHEDDTDLTFIANIQDGSHIGFRNIDLTGIKEIQFLAATREPGSVIEIRTGSPRGTLVGTAPVPQVENLRSPLKTTKATITNQKEQQDIYFVFRNTMGRKENILFVDWMFFDNGKMNLP